MGCEICGRGWPHAPACPRKEPLERKVRELEARRQAYDEQDWQFWELLDLIRDLKGHMTTATYCRPSGLQRFLDALPRGRVPGVQGFLRLPVGFCAATLKTGKVKQS